MAWAILIVAGILEVVWAYFLKQSEGFTRVAPASLSVVTMIASFGLLALAMKSLPLGVAYMIWTGIGAVGAYVVGILWLNEAVSTPRMIAASLIVGGLVLMRFTSPQ